MHWFRVLFSKYHLRYPEWPLKCFQWVLRTLLFEVHICIRLSFLVHMQQTERHNASDWMQKANSKIYLSFGSIHNPRLQRCYSHYYMLDSKQQQQNLPNMNIAIYLAKSFCCFFSSCDLFIVVLVLWFYVIINKV